MRLTPKLLLAGAALAAATAAMPASAQAGYYGYGPGGYRNDPCAVVRKDSQIGGMLLGGLIGGVLGSNVAARGHRDDGTALGAVVGGVLGSEIGRGSSRPCLPPPPPEPLGYNTGYNNGYQPGYADDDLYGRPSVPVYRDDPVYSNRDYRSREPYLADRDRYSYNSNNRDYAGTDCTTAEQTTRLPDGTEISRPVEACREARYGGWTIRD